MKKEVYDAEGWNVHYDPADNCLVVSTTDYHAEPLRLGLDVLAEKIQQSSSACHTSQDPANRQVSVTLLKDEQCASIALPEGWAGPVRISRKDLYRLGKSLGRRSRAGSVELNLEGTGGKR